MRQTFLTGRKFIAYWLFNIGLGIPTPYVLIYLIFGFYGFMSPPTIQARYMAAGVLCFYLLVWFVGNYMCLRKEDRGTKYGMIALSLLPLAISSFISFKIMASINS
ncbi:hypothetical protein AB4Z22_10010 [Paenibacillus sp. TAF58]